MAQIAKTEAPKVTARDAIDHDAELRKRGTDRAEDAARRSAEVVHRAAGAVVEVEREVARRSAEGTTKLGGVFVDLASQQTRHNLETLKALSGVVDWGRVAKAVDWDRVFQIQSEYLRVSLERTAHLTQRYLEVSQAVMTAAASATERRARKAA